MDDAAWIKRFRAPRWTLPSWAARAPERCLYASNRSGAVELHTWDRRTGDHRQVTSRPGGTPIGALDRSGAHVWWLDDSAGNQWGQWMRQPFGAPMSAAQPAAPDLPPAYPGGIALGEHVSVIGLASRAGSTIHLLRDGQQSLVYSAETQARVAGLSANEGLVAISHTEFGDPPTPAVRVLSVPTGETVGEFWIGADRPVTPCGFSPAAGDDRLLLSYPSGDQTRFLLWDPRHDHTRELALELVGAVDADWYPDGAALLVCCDHDNRTRLYRNELETEELTLLPTPAGAISGATARPDGTVEFSWSSATTPPQLRTTAGAVLLSTDAPGSVPIEEVRLDSGVTAIVACPRHLLPPYAAVFVLRDNAEPPDQDAYSARRAAWVDAGYAAVQVNCSQPAGVGLLDALIELSAVHEHLAQRFLLDPERCLIAGRGSGGTLALLAASTEPKRYAATIAAAPICDAASAYQARSALFRQIDELAFAGSPADNPDIYRQCSPITYADQLNGPILLIRPQDDPEYPGDQLERYRSTLHKLDKTAVVESIGASLDELVRQTGIELAFARSHVVA